MSGWRVRDRVLPWGEGHPTLLMAVLNATPDSFSDGGALADHDSVVAAGQRALADGAAILDVGGESTRPGAARIDVAAQLARTLEPVRRLAPAGIVSIDTTRAAVASAALEAGAAIVNDVSGATEDPAMLETVARTGAGVVLMHRRFAPDEDRWSTERDPRRPTSDVVEEVRDWLAGRIEAAERAGVDRASIAVDPGLGFGKDVGQNLRLLAAVDRLAALGVPVLVGASRKSFLGAVCGVEHPAERDAASVDAAVIAAGRGAAIIRAHAVSMHAHALRTVGAVRRA